jgi:predicted HAD superfamily phosphohydrolase YqeG
MSVVVKWNKDVSIVVGLAGNPLGMKLVQVVEIEHHLSMGTELIKKYHVRFLRQRINVPMWSRLRMDSW